MQVRLKLGVGELKDIRQEATAKAVYMDFSGFFFKSGDCLTCKTVSDDILILLSRVR